MSGPKSVLSNNKEKILLAVYLVGIIFFASLLTPMLGQAWERSGFIYSIFRLRHLVGIELESVAAFIIGIFISLLALMTYDQKKRLQGVLLLIGTAIGLVILAQMDLLLVNIDFSDHIISLVGGLAIGLLLGGIRKILNTASGQPPEFRRASKGVYIILVLITVFAFIEFHIAYPNPLEVDGQTARLVVPTGEIGLRSEPVKLLQNTVLSTGLIITTKRFVEYDAEQEFLVLGPKGSGKSLFLVGAYLQALERYSSGQTETPLQPSQDLMELVGKIDEDDDGWFVEATRSQELGTLEFQYVHGKVFPKNVTLSGIDYAGEWLEDLPDAILGVTDDEELPPTLSRVVDAVQRTDTLILLIDSERFINNEPLDVDPYFNILKAADDTDVVLVATKADLFAEEFRDEKGLEAHQYYDEFRQYITEKFSQNKTIETLFAEVSRTEIYPVYYQTRINDSGERVPMRNSGEVTTIGFEPLLNKLGET